MELTMHLADDVMLEQYGASSYGSYSTTGAFYGSAIGGVVIGGLGALAGGLFGGGVGAIPGWAVGAAGGATIGMAVGAFVGWGVGAAVHAYDSLRGH